MLPQLCHFHSLHHEDEKFDVLCMLFRPPTFPHTKTGWLGSLPPLHTSLPHLHASRLVKNPSTVNQHYHDNHHLLVIQARALQNGGLWGVILTLHLTHLS